MSFSSLKLMPLSRTVHATELGLPATERGLRDSMLCARSVVLAPAAKAGLKISVGVHVSRLSRVS